MKTAENFATWTCKKCGNTYSNSIEYCPNDGYSLQEELRNILFDQLKEARITRIDQNLPDSDHYSFHCQPSAEGIITVHFIK